jgi:hypothetical protein
MTQAPAAIFKIPTESPQLARGAVSRARKAAATPRVARRRPDRLVPQPGPAPGGRPVVAQARRHPERPDQMARTRRTKRVDQSGKASGHVDQAGRRSPDGAPTRHQPVTSMPAQPPPTRPASGRASRCPSASWQRHTARPHGGGRAPGWPNPGRDQLRVDLARAARCAGQAASASEQCATRHSPKVPADTREERRCWHAPVTGRLRCPRAGAGMFAAPAAARTWVAPRATGTRLGQAARIRLIACRAFVSLWLG